MTSNRWEETDRLCRAALQRTASERGLFLREACAGDEALRLEVESLLAHELSAEGFLTTPAADIAGRAMAEDAGVHAGVGTGNAGLRLVGPQFNGDEELSLFGAGASGEADRAPGVKLGRVGAIQVFP